MLLKHICISVDDVWLSVHISVFRVYHWTIYIQGAKEVRERCSWQKGAEFPSNYTPLVQVPQAVLWDIGLLYKSVDIWNQ